MAATVLGLILASACDTSTPATESGAIADLDVVVVERGVRREAHLRCAERNESSGYLAHGEFRVSACVAAVVNQDNARFLETGERPEPDGCELRQGHHEGDSVEIAGSYKGEDIHRTVVFSSACGDALWSQLGAIVTPSEKPVLPSSGS